MEKVYTVDFIFIFNSNILEAGMLIIFLDTVADSGISKTLGTRDPITKLLNTIGKTLFLNNAVCSSKTLIKSVV